MSNIAQVTKIIKSNPTIDRKDLVKRILKTLPNVSENYAQVLVTNAKKRAVAELQQTIELITRKAG